MEAGVVVDLLPNTIETNHRNIAEIEQLLADAGEDLGDEPEPYSACICARCHPDDKEIGLRLSPEKDRKSGGEGESVSVRVELGVRRSIKKKKKTKKKAEQRKT